MSFTSFDLPEKVREAVAAVRREQLIDRFGAAFSMTKVRAVKMRDILIEVSEKHGVNAVDIKGSTRNRRVVRARHEAFWRCRRETANSFPAIGRFFHRDHTTVIYGVRAHEARMASEGAG